MMFRRFAVCALVAAVALSLVPRRASAASKEIMELQRDVAGLQEQLRLLKESQDKQLAALTVLVQQALETSKSSTTGVAVIQNNLQQSLKDMESKVQTPVAGLSSRIDGMDQDMRTLQQAVSGGQDNHPDGVFYGGAGPTWSRGAHSPTPIAAL